MNPDSLINKIEAFPPGIEEFVVIFLILLQIFIAFLPGEPLELAAGYLFGGLKGTILCLVGAFFGTAAVYCVTKACKGKIIHFMFSKEKVDKFEEILGRKKTQMWIFILFLIPGTPKDIMTYVVSLTDIKLSRWLVIATLGRIPSIITSTYFAGSLRNCDLTAAVVIGMITIVLFVCGTLYYNRVLSTSKEN